MPEKTMTALTTMVSAEDRARIKRLAEAKGLSLQALAHAALSAYVERDGQPPLTPVRVPTPTDGDA